MKKSQVVLGTSAIAGLALMLTGCVPGGGAGGGEDRLTISMNFPPSNNWALESFDANVLSQIGCAETLLRFDPETNELEPLLATEWAQADPTTWEFTLREGVTYQDGTALTAETVVASLQHLLDLETQAPSFGTDTVTSVEAVDAQTVRITTPEESPLLPMRVASVNTALLAPAAYEGDAIDVHGTCTGPYEITNEVAAQSVTLGVYDGYWGDAPSIPSIEARFFPDGSTRATQVMTGESQAALALPLSSLPDLEGNPDVVIDRMQLPRTTGLYLNNAREPFDNPDVRRALQLAVDTTAIAEAIYGGGGAPAVGVFGADYAWSPEGAAAITADPEAASQMLEDAGIAEGSLTLDLIAYTERPEFSDLAAVIQSQLAEIGVTVSIVPGDYASLEPALLGGDYDMALLSRNQLATIADPGGYLVADYTCEGTYNISQRCDEATDALIDSAVGIMDDAERYAAYAEVAQHIHDEAITIPIVNEVQIGASRSTLQGFADDPLTRYAITTDLSFQ